MFIVLIVILTILTYAWILYPLVLVRVARRAVPSSAPAGGEQPFVDIIISAHNEEAVIGARLANLLTLDYPPDRVRIHIGVDGSDDRTEAIVRRWAETDPRIDITVRHPCQGKTSMLKALVAAKPPPSPSTSMSSQISDSKSQILVFSDANTMFEKDALLRLVAPLCDPSVGGVCGRLVFLDDAGAETRENLYWRMETLLKTAESHMDSCLGANGAIYAVRRELFWGDIPDNTIVDDFVIGMKVRERGFRMVYEPGAVALERTPSRLADEWRRRVRIGAGAFQAMAFCRACLLPRFGRFFVCFWSHKILRWFTPHLMVMLAVVALWCWSYGAGVVKTGGVVVLAAGAGFSALAALGRLTGPLSPLKAFDYFLTMQAALFVGFLRWCRGNLKGTWVRTERG